VKQRETLETITQSCARDTACVLRGAYRQHEISKQEVVGGVVAARTEGNLTIDRADSQRRLALAIDGKQNMRMLGVKALESRREP
jgi:hypothetical protein